MKVQVLSSAFEKNKETSDLPDREFKILDQEQNILYTSDEQFDIRHTTYFLWGVDDRVWVYSGDTGTFFWENELDTKEWQQHVYKRLHLVKSDYVMVEKLKLIESGSPSPHGGRRG
ncbi:MAG: hypothetical protein RH949_28760 [Coleofasciculus sp. A1-SPW-01]|uniref:hypothetical protein n=1 Tax=Coleofasciculus sp. A1-SPW-01 TaxID=3070819 RepID=UPI0032F61A3B